MLAFSTPFNFVRCIFGLQITSSILRIPFNTNTHNTTARGSKLNFHASVYFWCSVGALAQLATYQREILGERFLKKTPITPVEYLIAEGGKKREWKTKYVKTATRLVELLITLKFN